MYDRLAEKLKTTSALKWFPGRGAEESWIAEVEEELGFSLPPSYRWWLVHYGNARFVKLKCNISNGEWLCWSKFDQLNNRKGSLVKW
ncbi:SMI1/KNR4 family protein [Brevibacillus fortis]|uniref:SMI1/KNR4 family protein n=1 Tax=Brevibacillus fortis TaxID=2126352 RepID=UPI002E244F47|nr:SMI1/KNR4 family protein [Brevibacillus fortis]